MTAFAVGDLVQMPDVPIIVEVLEIGECGSKDCGEGAETFRFKDPETGEDDWAHSISFMKVE